MVINNKTSIAIIAASILALASITSPAQSEPYRTPQWRQPAVRAAQSTDRLIVKFKRESANALPSGVGRAKALTASAGAAIRHVRSMGDNVEVMGLPSAVSNEEARRIAAQIATDPNVEYAEPDYKMFPAATPSDPGFSPGIPFQGGQLVNQWYLFDTVGGINAPLAWDQTQGSSNTVIAVIDTGVLSHADLAGRLLQGYDFIGPDPDGSFDTANDGDGLDNDATDPGNWITPGEAGRGNFAGCPNAVDSDWHGTHVAGIIAANWNSDDIAGINRFAEILPVRALGKCGGYTSDIIDGMRWSAGLTVNGAPANSNPADIINLSLGVPADTIPPACSQSLQDAISDLMDRHITVVVAAGNGPEESVNAMPANCAGVISVGASLKNGQVASQYSNFGPLITLSAPGGLITDSSTDAGQDAILSLNDRGVTGPQNDNAVAALYGTSFSTAIVSGVASLLLAVNPNLTPAQIKAILQSTARRPSDPNDKGLDCLIVANRP
ncbi:MAG: S8 family peptidase, partial [Burkholderiales bacterium]